jgi:hypothetical protein
VQFNRRPGPYGLAQRSNFSAGIAMKLSGGSES